MAAGNGAIDASSTLGLRHRRGVQRPIFERSVVVGHGIGGTRSRSRLIQPVDLYNAARGIVVLVGAEETLSGDGGGLGAVVDTEFAVQAPKLGLDRVLAHVEVLGELWVGHAGWEERQ